MILTGVYVESSMDMSNKALHHSSVFIEHVIENNFQHSPLKCNESDLKRKKVKMLSSYVCLCWTTSQFFSVEGTVADGFRLQIHFTQYTILPETEQF